MDDQRTARLDRAALTQRLREKGLRATRPRLETLVALAETGGHLSVDEIVALLRQRGETIARMSVYNVMADLVRAGVVMIADAGPGRALYEVAHEWHHHFVCRNCGTVVDVPCAIGKKPCLHPDFDGGTVDEAQVIFRGVCNECSHA